MKIIILLLAVASATLAIAQELNERKKPDTKE
jgi:hypothetical protein